MVLVGMVVLKLLIYNVLYDFSFKRAPHGAFFFSIQNKSTTFAWLINKT